VALNVSIDEKHLDDAFITVEDQVTRLVRIKEDLADSNFKGTHYQAIISMPNSSGEYDLHIISKDLAGNQRTLEHEFTVAAVNFNYYPVPIQNLSIDDSEIPPGLPYINSSAELQIPMVFGEITDIMFFNETVNNAIILDVSDNESITLSSVPEGRGIVSIRTSVEYHFFDYLFVSFPIPPFLFGLPFVLIGGSLLTFFIFISVVIILSFLFLFKSSLSGAFDLIKKAGSKLRAPMMETDNSLIMLGQLFIALYSFNLLFSFILRIGQVSTRVPDFASLSNWAFIYNLTSAAVYEEIISRVLLIGIPLFIIHAVLGRLKDSKRNYLLGGGFSINKLTIILIIFSSITFGLAHAPGWDYWKVIPTFVSGFALGYLFIKKGIFASILLHFMFNFLSIPLRIFGNPFGLACLYSILILFWITAGIIYQGYYLSRIIKFFRKKQPEPQKS
jgi:membrane protease YdiL (CAAX protease family)